MRVCVIGNSQIAALQNGWKAIEGDRPGVTVDFFGAVSPLWNGLVVEDKELTAPSGELRQMLEYTSGGQNRITGEYDRYIVCGMKLGPKLMVDFLDEDFIEDDFDDEDFIEEVRKAVHDSLALFMVRNVRKITTAPVAVLPAPYHCETGPADSYGRAIPDWMARQVRDYYKAILHDMGVSDGFVVRHQPAETVAAALRTKRRYREGAQKLGGLRVGQHRQDDYQHMNAEFGALCWGEIFPA